MGTGCTSQPVSAIKSKSGWGRNRTADTRIFSPLLCQLSYPAATDADLATCLGVPTMQQSNCRASDPLAIGPAGDPPPRGFGVASAPALQKFCELALAFWFETLPTRVPFIVPGRFTRYNRPHEEDHFHERSAGGDRPLLESGE